MRPTHSLTGIIAAGVVALLSSGCTRMSPPVEYYTLAPLSRTEAAIPVKPDFTVAVRPVTLPDSLDRPHIVTRTGDNTVGVADSQRWAGLLKKDFTRVMVENLNILLQDVRAAVATDDIGLEHEFIVAVNVNRFDGQLGDSVWLSAVWSLKHLKGRQELSVRKSLITEKTETSDYSGLVAAHSRAVAALSREIAAEIKNRRGQGAPPSASN